MKRTAFLVVILALIIGGIAFMSNRKASNSDEEYAGNFAVENIEDVQRVVISKGREYSIDLKKTSRGWVVNDGPLARMSTLETVLDAIENIEVKYIPTKKAEEHIMWDIAANGIQVDVYGAGEDLLKSYFVASANIDESGTHALMNGASQPFVVYLPSMDGGLRARYQLTMDEWRDRHFMPFNSNEVKRVSVEFPRQRSQSFVLAKEGDAYTVEPMFPDIKAQTHSYRTGTGDLFVKSLADLACESYKNEYPFIDSIRTLIPFSEMKVEFVDDSREEIVTRVYPNGVPVYSEFTGPLHRLFFDVNPGDFVGAQYHVVSNILKGYDYFFDGPEEELVFK